jgi:hypothetical protein
MTLIEREREALTAAPSHAELVLRLRAVVRDALETGTSQNDVLADLQRLRVELRQDDPEREDVVLDVMDFVEGWASPHVAMHDLELRRNESRPR